jgi:hypothetical protein
MVLWVENLKGHGGVGLLIFLLMFIGTETARMAFSLTCLMAQLEGSGAAAAAALLG